MGVIAGGIGIIQSCCESAEGDGPRVSIPIGIQLAVMLLAFVSVVTVLVFSATGVGEVDAGNDLIHDSPSGFSDVMVEDPQLHIWSEGAVTGYATILEGDPLELDLVIHEGLVVGNVFLDPQSAPVSAELINPGYVCLDENGRCQVYSDVLSGGNGDLILKIRATYVSENVPGYTLCAVWNIHVTILEQVLIQTG